MSNYIITEDDARILQQIRRKLANIRFSGLAGTVNDEGIVIGPPFPQRKPSASQSASPMSILWGKVYSAWSAGSNNITLTPYTGPLAATAAATGAANVDCYIHFPLDLPAIGFGASVGDLIGYIALPGVFNPSTFAQLYMLWQPPIIPRPTDAFQVYQNASSGGGSNMTMDWVKAHG